MTESFATVVPEHVDLASIGWTCALGALTFACLRVRSRFEAVASGGRVAEMLAHVVIAYFGLGMLAFGAVAALNARFPVPGGSAWEGPVAVIGGMAAFTIGACTLTEHVVLVLRQRREAVTVAVRAETY